MIDFTQRSKCLRYQATHQKIIGIFQNSFVHLVASLVYTTIMGLSDVFVYFLDIPSKTVENQRARFQTNCGFRSYEEHLCFDDIECNTTAKLVDPSVEASTKSLKPFRETHKLN
jgi:hypothetical protein